jgi:hypothetical protein
MSIRHVLKTVAATSAATVCCAVFALGVGSGVAGANTLTSGDGNTTLTTQGTVTSGPYTSGQQISLNVGANSVMNTTNLANNGAPTTGLFYVEECTDTGGTTAGLPTNATGCEAATLITGPKASDGHLALTGTSGPTIYDLPDTGTLGSPTMTGKCDVAPNQCVIGIFAANPSPAAGNGFAFPHLFSAPFQVIVGDGSDAGNNPGDGTPEVPLAVGLPLAALAVFGGFTVRNRRRRQRQAA